MKTKMIHAATHAENNMGSEVKQLPIVKIKGKKHVLDGVLL